MLLDVFQINLEPQGKIHVIIELKSRNGRHENYG